MTDRDLAESTARWYFYKGPTGTWRWDAVALDGTTISQSELAFESRAACIENARDHGFGSKPRDDEVAAAGSLRDALQRSSRYSL